MLPPVTPFTESLDVDDSLVAVEGRWRPVWRRLRKDRLALAGAALVLAFIAMALAAPHLAPPDPNARFYNGISADGAPLPLAAWFAATTPRPRAHAPSATARPSRANRSARAIESRSMPPRS